MRCVRMGQTNYTVIWTLGHHRWSVDHQCQQKTILVMTSRHEFEQSPENYSSVFFRNRSYDVAAKSQSLGRNTETAL